MTHRPLPPGTPLEALKDEAKALLKSAKAGAPVALHRVEPYFDPAAPKLQQMQLVLAREYGFESWNKLKSHIELRDEVGVAQREVMKLVRRMRATWPGRNENEKGIADEKALYWSEEDAKTMYCSFCGKSQHEVIKLIAGPSVYICNECVGLCVNITNEETAT